MTLKATILATGLASAGSLLAACPEGTKDLPLLIDGKAACQVSGTYTKNLVFDQGKIWVLSGGVFVGGDNKDNATLFIQPGTKIIGQSGADFLVIRRGSKIMAVGTMQAPIVFTSAKPAGRRNRGDWGGLVINGNAPINGCKTAGFCEAEGEGNTGLYGGLDAADSSGVLKFVRVEFAGNEITPENELNGIAFQGVGQGTVVDYIQVHMNADDGVEFFGGTVNAKHILLTGNRDDSLDWVLGWQGKMQHVMVQQFEDQANHGIEADNLSSPQDAEPRSHPTISNMTLIGVSTGSAVGGHGMLLRRGTGADILNSIITGFKSSCINIDDRETFAHVAIRNTLVSCAKNFTVDSSDVFDTAAWFTAEPSNIIADPLLKNGVPTDASPVIGAGETPFDFFFDEVDYIGAIKDSASDWTKGWSMSERS